MNGHHRAAEISVPGCPSGKFSPIVAEQRDQTPETEHCSPPRWELILIDILH